MRRNQVRFAKGKPDDRRSDRRYPLALDIAYQLIAHGSIVRNGYGHSVNLSSGGVLIVTETSLPNDETIELSIAWPAKVNQLVTLNLHARGRTLRSDGNGTAVALEGYEFRTRGQIPGNSPEASELR